MLTRLTEIFAVLIAGVGLMAAGAGLYAWLGTDEENDASEQASTSDSTLDPLLNKAQVLELLEIHLLGATSEGAQECYSQGASNTKFEGGEWTVGLVGTSCQGLQVYSVTDQTGEVATIYPVPTVAAAPTPTFEAVTQTDGELPVDPGLEPPAISEHANLIGFIGQYLVDTGAMDPECITSATVTAEVIPGTLGPGARWSVTAENDITAQLTFGCIRLHFYEVNEQTGEVVRTSGR